MRHLAGIAVVLAITFPHGGWAQDKDCVGKRFMVQRSLGDISLFSSNVGLASKKGAEISFKEDRENDSSVVTLNAALVWLPKALVGCPPKDLPPGGGLKRGGYAFAPFLALSGTSGAATDKNDLRFGITSQVQLISGETLHELSFSPYYRTDFEGEAKITGLQARWVPYNIDARLNGYIASADSPQLSWQFALETDYLHVDRSGESGLTEGEEYGWIGGSIGASVEFPKIANLSNGMVFSTSLSAHRDVVGDRDAALGTLAANFLLSESGSSSIRVGYSKGRDFSKFKEIDELSVNLTVSF